MQTHCLLNLSDKATADKARLIGGNGDSGVRNAEKPSLHPSTRLMPTRKRIALVAHDNQKDKMAGWALKHRTRLIEHELYATAHTADIIAEVLNAPVFRFLSGPLGGDQQIGSRIAESSIDVLNKQMNESNYLSGEFTDEFLHAQADAGDYFLDDEGLEYRPTQDEMQKLALEGQSLLFIDCLKGK